MSTRIKKFLRHYRKHLKHFQRWGGLLEDIAWTIEFCKGSPEKQLLKGAGARADKKGPKRTKRRRRGKRGGNSAGNLISSVEKVSAEDCLYFLSPPQ